MVVCWLFVCLFFCCFVFYVGSVFFVFFFFSSRRRHTRWNCDWSSDVCSSDLAKPQEGLMAIKNVGVIGCGLMGSGIVQVSAQAGFSVLFVEANDELVKRGLGRLRDTLEGLTAKGKLEAKARDEALGRIAGTTKLEDLKACDLVIEAMTENQALKNETFAKLDRIAAPHALLASNTSSCNVTALAAATRRPARVLGMHFFNPVPLMKLVEVVRTILTEDAAVQTATEFVRAVGKVPVQ